jgi:MFS family permease
MIRNTACCANWQTCCPGTVSDMASMVPTIIASLAMAVGGMSDAFLYAYLPVHSTSLGIGAIALGMILSINKFVRFFFNRWVNALAHTLGLRNILLAALIIAAITSLSYQFAMPLWLWLLSRTTWGAAYAMFRFSSVQYADIAPSKGKAIGLTTALRELGPIAAYFIGPFILSKYGPQTTFTAAFIFTLMCIPLVYRLPLMKSDTSHPHTFKFQKGNWLDAWTFLAAFLVDGLIVVAMSLLINFKDHQNTDNILWITAGFIAIRRVLQMLIAPISGWLIHHFGYKKTFMASAFAFIPGLLLLLADYSTTGIIFLSLAAVINNVTLPLFALNAKNTADNYNTFTKLATAKDIGGAIGALIGVWLVQQLDQQFLFSGLLVFTAITLYKNTKFVKQYGAYSAHT